MTQRVLGFTGHQGLDKTTTRLVTSAIATLVDERRPLTGVCSLAEGSDQIFAQAVLDSGSDLVVIVPCRKYEDTFNDAAALASYRRLLRCAGDVVDLDYQEPSEAAFWSAGKVVVQSSDGLIAVWDGKPAAGLGGSADVVSFAREQGKPVEVIWPEGSARF